MTDPETTPADIAHGLAQTYDAPTLAHALAARLAAEGKSDAAAAVSAMIHPGGIVADSLPSGPPDPHQT